MWLRLKNYTINIKCENIQKIDFCMYFRVAVLYSVTYSICSKYCIGPFWSHQIPVSTDCRVYIKENFCKSTRLLCKNPSFCICTLPHLNICTLWITLPPLYVHDPFNTLCYCHLCNFTPL